MKCSSATLAAQLSAARIDPLAAVKHCRTAGNISPQCWRTSLAGILLPALQALILSYIGQVVPRHRDPIPVSLGRAKFSKPRISAIGLLVARAAIPAKLGIMVKAGKGGLYAAATIRRSREICYTS